MDYQSEHAKVTVTYHGYSLDSFVERKIHEEQTWRRESRDQPLAGAQRRGRLRQATRRGAPLKNSARRVPHGGARVDNRRCILIVDDTPLFRDIESLFLARSGRVITARDADEGLAAARRERPDIAVIDLHMPGQAGDDMCRTIKADPELRRVPVIVVMGSNCPEDHERAIRAGADDVLAKPLSRVTLIHAVNRFLRSPLLRGLARVRLETAVRIRLPDEDAWGTARNLSRGGIFVELEHPISPSTEVELEFRLPDLPIPLAPTAQVVWHRPGAPDAPMGLGLQFLALDGASAQRIEAFVHEHLPAVPQSLFTAVAMEAS